jgi:hypothetical protein
MPEMVLFNYSTRELTAKVVFYGPGLCGKTTNLQYIHANLPDGVKGRMLSLATKTDRTLFFDFLPIDLGDIRGMKTRVQLYTVPGQVFYNETRKLVLKGADGIVFVADSQEPMLGANIESFRNLEENLRGHGMRLEETPHVIQFNKRDLPRLASIEDLNAAINRFNAPFYESVATSGIGVQDTLKAIVKLVLLHLTRKYETKTDPRGTGTGAGRALPQSPPAATFPQGSHSEPAHSAAVARPRLPAEPQRSVPSRLPVEPFRPQTPPMQSVPVSEFDTPFSRPVAIPLSQEAAAAATVHPRPAVPPPPVFRDTGVDADGTERDEFAFDSDEIDGLVDEVDAFEETPLPVDDIEWMPPVAEPPQTPVTAPSVAGVRPEPLSTLPEPAWVPPAVAPSEDLDFESTLPTAQVAFGPVPLDIVEEHTPVAAPGMVGHSAHAITPPASRDFEVDVSFDPAWHEEPAEFEEMEDLEEIEPTPDIPVPVASSDGVEEMREPMAAEPTWEAEADEASPAAGQYEATPVPVRYAEAPSAMPVEDTVVLEEIAQPSELFEDPTLDVARLAAGEAREIVVPVEIAEGTAVRRFKLSIRLKLDPLD